MKRWLQQTLLALALLGSPGAPLHAAPLSDDAVKAAVIYKVMLFTRWPDEGSEAPLTLCVVGRDEVAAALPDLHGRRIGTRALHIRQVAGPAAFNGCSAAYIAAPEQNRLGSLLSKAAGQRPLTVVDCGEALCNSDAVLSLAVQAGRLVFAINRRQAEQQGLSFSAQVLRLSQPERVP
ncbi:MAG: YfiR family protein [Pseudomonadota bacterium]